MAHEINSNKAGNNKTVSKALTVEKSKSKIPLQVQKKPAVLHCVWQQEGDEKLTEEDKSDSEDHQDPLCTDLVQYGDGF